MSVSSLSQLQPSETAHIQSIQTELESKQRLLDLGFVPGALIQCLYRNPSGSNTAYRIHDTIIALRHTDASLIHITPPKPQNHSDTLKTIVLVGNPNVGKSTLFNRLTGQHQHTGNWTGKTVALASGICTQGTQPFRVIDLPGCYSLTPDSQEEQISYDYIQHGAVDAILVVCDSNCIERNLLLALQLQAIFSPIILVINCMDEASRKQISIDFAQLSACLTLPVIGIAAGTGQGIPSLLQCIHSTLSRNLPQHIPNTLPNPSDLLDRATSITAQCVTYGKDRFQQDRAIDHILLGKWTGVPIMLFLLTFLFWLTMCGANYPSQWLRLLFLYCENWMSAILTAISTPIWLQDCLLNGIYRTVSWVVAVMLPPVAIFFPLFSILEECGYLPRIAFSLDGCFQKAGTCGKQCLTSCMSLGCNAAGVTGCRIIASPRERFIAILTSSFIPCNGKLPMLISILSLFFVTSHSMAAPLLLLGLLALSFMATLAISKLLSCTLLRGMPSSFILELPPYRKPDIRNIVIQSLRNRTLFVLLRAISVAAPAGFLLWLLTQITINGQPFLCWLAQILHPIAQPFGMDGIILLAFLLGWPANEIVIPLMLMLYLTSGTMVEPTNDTALKHILLANSWTWQTAASVLLFALFHWPCSTTCLTIRKETGSLRWTLLAILLPTTTGLLLCFLFQQTLQLLGLK